MGNPFATAKVLEPEKPKAASKNAEEVAVDGLGAYAVLKHVYDNFEALCKTQGNAVKGFMAQWFTERGRLTKSRPANFKGRDRLGRIAASASLQLRARGGNSPLNEVEAAALDKAGIPYERVVETPECFAINPAYSSDAKLMAKIAKALETVKGLPEDLIVVIPERAKRIATDDSVSAVFQKGLAESLLPVVATLAIRSKLEGDPDFKDVLEAAKELAGLVEEQKKGKGSK